MANILTLLSNAPHIVTDSVLYLRAKECLNPVCRCEGNKVGASPKTLPVLLPRYPLSYVVSVFIACLFPLPVTLQSSEGSWEDYKFPYNGSGLRKKIKYTHRELYSPINGSTNKKINRNTIKTRWAGQSPTWGRPAPQVRVESQFRYSKFHSQQWQLVNDSEKNHLAYAPAYSIRAVRVHQYARCNFFVCGPKFITWPEKVWWENSN